MTRVVLQLRMSEAEKTRLREAAESAGKTMSEYVMERCLGAAEDLRQKVEGDGFAVPSTEEVAAAVKSKVRCPRCRREERVKGRLPEKCEVCDG